MTRTVQAIDSSLTLSEMVQSSREKQDPIYSGIGSRRTPASIQATIKAIANRLASMNFILRSGSADGADTAFEIGARSNNGRAEIYLPWAGFQGRQYGEGNVVQSPKLKSWNKAFEMAAPNHKRWGILKESVRKLHARNAMILMGNNLNKPSDFVICWTDTMQSGTGQAIRMAKNMGIPVFNLIDMKEKE